MNTDTQQKEKEEHLRYFARYAFHHNRFKYFKEDIHRRYFAFAKGEGVSSINEDIEKNYAIGKFLSTIAKAYNSSQFDPRVVKAYFLGSNLLSTVPQEEIQKLMTSFKIGGDEEKIIKEIPQGITLCHNFHVFHVNHVSKGLHKSTTHVDKCRISTGKIVGKKENMLEVIYTPLAFNEKTNKIEKQTKTKKMIHYHEKISGPIQIGDIVSMHWDHAIEKLSNEQAAELMKHTDLNRTLLNNHFAKRE